MAKREWSVNVGLLRHHPGSVSHEVRAGALPGLTVIESRVPDDALVTVDVTVQVAEGAVVAHGTVSAPWVGVCRRCLRPAAGEIETEVRELFEPDGDGDDTYPLRGDQVDLEPLARDAVLLGLPLAPLCTEGCLGLCPICGANRNEGDCGHRDQPTDPRWAGLDVLKADQDNS